MCGISVLYRAKGVNKDDFSIVERMLELQKNRGPDHTGIRQENNCILGHNRLSILDISSRSNQPLKDTIEDVWISFNGEIFNYQELRSELIRNGCIFKTESDTEVLLKLYITYGEEFVKRLNGQFSFVIYDTKQEKVFAARDHTGIIPLYYYHSTKCTIFSSSFKAINKHVPFRLCEQSLEEYMYLRFVLPPHTLNKHVHQLEPGQLLCIQEGALTKRYFWKIEINQKNRSLEEHTTKIPKILKEATTKRLQSDVPIGIFLSGGLDSSIICSLASQKQKNLKSYSIRFSEYSNEENTYSKLMSSVCGTEHKIYDVSKTNLQPLIDEWVQSIDHPNGARDMFAVYLLCKFVKEQDPDTKVILTGTGADEILNGYVNAYFSLERDGQKNTDTLIEEFIEQYSFTNKDYQHVTQLLKKKQHLNRLKKHLRKQINEFNSTNQSDQLNLLNFLYVKTHLLGWELPTADNMGMAWSLELRPPFLDHTFIEYAFSIQGKHKLFKNQEKYVLRESFRNTLPKSITQRSKGPFSKQVMEFLIDEYSQENNELINSLAKYIKTDHLNQLNFKENSDLLWRLFILAKWLERNNCHEQEITLIH